MNFKKLKRMLSIVLSATMILSTNMTGLAASVESVPEQQEWKFDTEITDDGISRYVSDDGAVMYTAESPADESETGTTTPTETTTPEESNSFDVDGTKYATLNEAFKAAGTTVTMEADAVLEGAESYDLSQKTIQTKGHTITIAEGAKIRFNGGTFKNEVLAETNAQGSYGPGAQSRTILSVKPGAKLVIEGNGTYTTKGVQLLRAEGDVTIQNGSFTCNATLDEIGSNNRIYYNGSTLFSVLGEQGKITMEVGTVDVSTIGSNTQGRMYAIFAFNKGTLVLGKKASTNADGAATPASGPTVKGGFAAIGMNTSVPEASLTINGGTYTSEIADAQEGYNTVLGLFAACTLTINGGTFKANGTGTGATNIHAVTFSGTDNQTVAINGGTFESAGSVFYNAASIGKVVKGGTFSSKPDDACVAVGYKAKAGTGDDINKWIVSPACLHKKNNSDASAIQAVEAVPATCWTEGVEAHYACSVCGQKFFSPDGAKGTELSDEAVTIPRTNHEGVYVPAVTAAEASCTVGVHDAYYYCKNCKKGYPSMMELKENKNALTETQMTGTPTGHRYVNTADWGVFNNVTEVADKAAFIALYEQFETAFKKGDDIVVTVKSVCSVCGEENPDIPEATATVTSDAIARLKADCTTAAGITVILTATLPAEGAQAEKETAATVTHTVKIKPAAHSYKYIYAVQKPGAAASALTADTEPFDISQDEILVKRYCEYCGEESSATEADAAVTPVKADGSQITVGCFNEKMALKVTATFTPAQAGGAAAASEAQPAAETVTKDIELTVKGQGHSLKNQSYKEPSCFEDGYYSHYRCTREGGCGMYFRNPTAVDREDAVAQTELAIPAIDHSFSAPKFDWQDKNARLAKATFTCLKCGATIARTNLRVNTDEAVPPANYDCKTPTAVSYPVIVEFDRACVHTLKDANGNVLKDGFGDPLCEYRENEPAEGKESFKAEFKGGVEDENIVIGHKLVIDSTDSTAVAWADDSPASGNYYDVAKGAKVTLKCQNPTCNGTITVTKKQAAAAADTSETTPEDGFEAANIAVSGGIAATEAEAFLKQVKNTNKTLESTCTADGEAVYDIIVKCKTDDGKPVQEYSELSDGKPVQLKTDTKATGHDFQVKLTDDVAWDSKQPNFDPENPTDVRVKLTCSHDEHHTTNVIIQPTDTGAFKQITESDKGNATYGGLYTNVYKKLTCTQDGVNVWAITITTDDGKTITNFNTSASTPTGTAAVTETEGGTEAPAENKGLIYLTKTHEATGHDYKAPVWDAAGFINGTDKEIYYAYECQSANCDGAGKDLEGQELTVGAGNTVKWTTTQPDGKGKTIRRVSAKLSNSYDTEPTCTKPGVGKTVANVTVNGQAVPAYEHTGTVPALGHAWSNTVQWTTFTKDPTATATVTIGEKDCTVPVCSITGSRVCTREDCDAPTDRQNASSTFVKKGDTFTPAEGTIAIKAKSYTAETCETDGEVIYDVEYYGTVDGGTDIEKVASREEKVTLPKKNHDYSTQVTLDWDHMTEEPALDKDGNPLVTSDGKSLYTGRFIVPAYRVCANDAKHHEEVPVIATVTSGDCNADSVVFEAEIREDYQPEASVAIPSDQKTKTKTFADGHSFTRIEASTSNDCMKPSYGAHYHCANCGKNYGNRSATMEADISYEAQDHTYGNPVAFQWIKKYEIIQAVFECSRCHSKDSIRTFDAQIDPEGTYTEGTQTCQNGATAYYSVNIDLRQHPDKHLFSSDYYALEEMVDLPKLDRHNIVDGKCTWCNVSYVRLTFTGVNGSDIISEKDYLTDVTDVEIPTAPNRFGYTFEGWSFDGKTYATETEKTTLKAEIIAALAEKQPITVQAIYTPAEAQTGTVKIAYVDKDGNEIKASGEADVTEANIGENCDVTITEANKTITAAGSTYLFSHWADGEQNVLGTGESYQVYVQSADEITVYAVYVTDEKDKEKPSPTIAMTKVYASKVDGANKVSFTATISIPDGFTRLDSGILYGTAASVFTGDNAEDTVVLDSGNTKIKVCTIDGDKTNTLSINVGSVTNRPVYARGYLRYRDTTGETKVVYTNIVNGVFETLYQGE